MPYKRRIVWYKSYLGKISEKSFYYTAETREAKLAEALAAQKAYEEADPDHIIVNTPPAGYTELPKTFFGDRDAMMARYKVIYNEQVRKSHKRKLEEI